MLSDEVLDLRKLEDATLLGLTNLNLPAALKAAAKRELDSRTQRGPRFEQMPEGVPFKHDGAWYIWKRYPAIGKPGSFAFKLTARNALSYDDCVDLDYVGESYFFDVTRALPELVAKNGGMEMIAKLTIAASGDAEDEDYD